MGNACSSVNPRVWTLHRCFFDVNRQVWAASPKFKGNFAAKVRLICSSGVALKTQHSFCHAIIFNGDRNGKPCRKTNVWGAWSKLVA